MIIERIHINNLKIPFSRTIQHRLSTRSVTESIVVVLEDRHHHQGVGEGTPRDYVTGETLENSLMAARLISKAILGQPFDTVSQLYALIENRVDANIADGHPAALCAIETAVLDLWAKIEKQPVYRLFGQFSNNRMLSYSGVIPSTDKEQAFLQYIEMVRRLKLTSLKIKVVDLESGLAQLAIIREQLGSALDVRVDANAAFTADTAIQFIHRAEPMHLSAVEQPVPKDDLAGLKKVSDHSDIPIIADESMYTSKGPFYLIDNDICHGLNIRLSSCGGFRNAYHIYQRARSKQMTIVVGAHVGETAILSFAGRHLAMICEDARYLEGSFSTYVIQEDLVAEDISFGEGGVVPLLNRPGLGIEINPSAIAKWSERFACLLR
ncbi:mandelate racemase/muconate lactonizing enzyme family protein [Desulfosarcina sp.]|uniref:mandelate racemase/muconate lactonizing enzyme family protein n=1 Tax=Desulfosarcina sp. TaxID=2027861 RepID=UPI00356A7A5D